MELKQMIPINVVFIGESTVGKSSIFNRLLKREFNDFTLTTLGNVQGYEQIIDNKSLPNIKIQIIYWDTPGQEKYHAMCTQPIKKADIIIFVTDNEKDGLLEDANWMGWIKFVEDNVRIDSPDKKLIFCLNKTDLILDEEVKNEKFEYLQNIAESENLNAEVLLISAKNSDGIYNLKSKIKSFSINLVKTRLNNKKDEVNIGLFGQSLVGKTSLINRIINNEFQESTILTFKLNIKECFVTDLNSHEIKLNYYDIPGQNGIMEKYIDILKKIEIIIFVNDNEKTNIAFDKVEEIIKLLERKIIFCINKEDLIPNREKFISNYKKINQKNGINIEPILVSAKSGKEIENLKKLIIKISLEIIKKKNEDKGENEVAPLNNDRIVIDRNNYEEVNEKHKSCWEKFCDLFR